MNQAKTASNHYHNPKFNGKVVKPQTKTILSIMRGRRKKGFTIGELAQLTGLQKSSVSARRNELLEDKINKVIYRGLSRKCTISGVTCETVHLKL